MKVQEICSRPPICCAAETSVAQAAQLMRKHHVGTVIVTASANASKQAVGILTDRDIAVSVVAPELDARAITVGDIMQQALASAQENEDVFAALKRMCLKGVRRLPIVDRAGEPVGLLALDDVLEVLIGELQYMVQLISREQSKEVASRH